MCQSDGVREKGCWRNVLGNKKTRKIQGAGCRPVQAFTPPRDPPISYTHPAQPTWYAVPGLGRGGGGAVGRTARGWEAGHGAVRAEEMVGWVKGPLKARGPKRAGTEARPAEVKERLSADLQM